jgi:hypothetical protein
MKKLFLGLLLLAGILNTTQAQVILSGSYGFDFIQSEGDSESSFRLIPRIGYAKGNWVGGLDVGFVRTKTIDDATVRVTQVGPFLRYIKKTNDFMGIWGEAQVGGAFGRTTENDVELGRSTTFSSSIRPGVIFFFGQHLSFEASFGSVGFSTTNYNPAASDDNSRISEFGLNLGGSNILLGVNYMF